MSAAGQTPAGEQSKPVDEHRLGVEVAVEPDEPGGRVDGSAVRLVRVVLTENGPVTREDGTTYHRPDVVCPMRPGDARELAGRLAEAATRAEHGSTRQRTIRVGLLVVAFRAAKTRQI